MYLQLLWGCIYVKIQEPNSFIFNHNSVLHGMNGLWFIYQFVYLWTDMPISLPPVMNSTATNILVLSPCVCVL